MIDADENKFLSQCEGNNGVDTVAANWAVGTVVQCCQFREKFPQICGEFQSEWALSWKGISEWKSVGICIIYINVLFNNLFPFRI